MYKNEHIASLGYKLESTTDVTLVKQLLEISGVEPVFDEGDQVTEYLMATTTAGGLAACAGWTRTADTVVLHSLAVAPPSRGSGVGASLMAQALWVIMNSAPVEAVYLMATAARRFFASFGFVAIDEDEIPAEVGDHATFRDAPPGSTPMARHYKITPRGFDQCAFRLLENQTANAVLPVGSVIFFRQTGQMLEASYRGGPVMRGHILGRIDGDEITYLWHAYASNDDLLHGNGEMVITSGEDGRRELQEVDVDDVMLRMREV